MRKSIHPSFLCDKRFEYPDATNAIADEVLKAARVGRIIQYRKLPAGPEINDSDSIIIVEGRADIAACLRAGVRNTIAVEELLSQK